jgi:colanic acid/amylovoran biosynthesis protein
MFKEKDIILYGHAGSYNHGAEAITSCVIEKLRHVSPNCRIILSTHFAEQDRQFFIDADEFIERDIRGVANNEVYAPTIERIHKDSICIHVGGDNYCYRNWQRYALIHQRAIEKGAVSILLGCSIEPGLIDREMLDILKTHSLITARESVTYDALVERGLRNVVKVTDIAFSLKPQPTDFQLKNFVAINISPLVIKENPMIQKAIEQLVNYILTETDMSIVLIPHCLISVNNDCDALRQIDTHNSERVVFISENLLASQYKAIISQARFGVFARTHAAIAAYSSLVPTLAIGYSVKSWGIASDLGMSDYVVDIQSIHSSTDLLKPFFRLVKNEAVIRDSLSRRMPEYTKNTVCEQVLNLIG